MSTIINADTSDGLKFTSDTSGEIKLQSAGADTVTVNSSGNVGVGTTSPDALLTVNTIASFGDGAVGTPSIAHKGDLNTGMWFPAADTIAFSEGGTEAMRIDSSGNVLVGTTSNTPSGGTAKQYNLATGTTVGLGVSVNNTAYSLINFFYNNSTLVGTISTNGTGVTYGTSSDYRLKENIAPMTGALDKVAQLKPVTYTWKADGSNGQGFIAHELQAVVPDCVTGEKDAVNEDGSINPQGIDTSKLVATLTKAIQEQQEQIKALETRIQALENA